MALLSAERSRISDETDARTYCCGGGQKVFFGGMAKYFGRRMPIFGGVAKYFEMARQYFFGMGVKFFDGLGGKMFLERGVAKFLGREGCQHFAMISPKKYCHSPRTFLCPPRSTATT